MEPAAGSSGAAAGAIAAGRLKAAVLPHLPALAHEDCLEVLRQTRPLTVLTAALVICAAPCRLAAQHLEGGLVRRPGSSGALRILSMTLTADCRDWGQATCPCSIAVADKPGWRDLCLISAADAQAGTAFAADGKALFAADRAPAALPPEGSEAATDERLRPLPADASRRSGQDTRMLSPRNSRNRGPSQDSAGSAGPESSSRSQRSSFARERASVEGNRASLEIFQAMAPAPAQVEAVPVSYEDMEIMCDQLGIPKAMRDRCVAAATL